MSWDPSRRKPGRPSSNASLRDELYERLLSRAREGGDPPATPKEYAEWADLRRQHPGESVPPFSEAVPWPIRRYLARRVLDGIGPEQFILMCQTMAEDTADDVSDSGHVPAVDHVELRRAYAEWRAGFAAAYDLDVPPLG